MDVAGADPRGAGQAQRALRRGRLVVALSGADGAGKTTLIGHLRQELEALAIPSERVWSRPGHGLGLVGEFVDWLKRAVKGDQRSGTRRMIEGTHETAPISRKGITGWVWCLVVVIAYLIDVRRQFRRATGVMIVDRHRLDAAVTLDVLYRAERHRLAHALCRRLLPPAHLTYYLDVDAETAGRRKPRTAGPTLEAQIRGYRRQLPDADVAILDATWEPERLAKRIIADILDHA